MLTVSRQAGSRVYQKLTPAFMRTLAKPGEVWRTLANPQRHIHENLPEIHQSSGEGSPHSPEFRWRCLLYVGGLQNVTNHDSRVLKVQFPTVPEGHKHRVTTPEKPRKIPRTPAEPRGAPQNPERTRGALGETPAEPSERQISSESLAEGCAPRTVTLRNFRTVGTIVHSNLRRDLGTAIEIAGNLWFGALP